MEVIPLQPRTPTETGAGDEKRVPKGNKIWKDGGEFGAVGIKATVTCFGKTGVEMEALAAVMGAGLTVYDMCKAVDKGMWMEGVRVVEKRGGRSGDWRVVEEGEEEEGEKAVKGGEGVSE